MPFQNVITEKVQHFFFPNVPLSNTHCKHIRVLYVKHLYLLFYYMYNK